MTALTQYQRLEASGLWRASAEDQRREVIVSIGDATLVISDMNDRALTHWSLAAVERHNPGETPAVYGPDGDQTETLELAADEVEMIEAIEKLRTAIEKARPHPGRLRWLSVVGVVGVVAAVLALWLPGALRQHTVSVVPDIKRQEIGQQLLARIERVTGRSCFSPDALSALAALSDRSGAGQIAVMRTGINGALALPGGTVLLSRQLVEDQEDPVVTVGHVLAARASAMARDPLDALLDHAGAAASFRLLTTGNIDQASLDGYAEYILTAPPTDVPDELLLGLFEQAAIPSSPFAYATDPSGETVLGLIEADPMRGAEARPVMKDRDWVLLQNICS